jgi:hypothetical protein
MANYRPINIGKDAERFFLDKIPNSSSEVTHVDRSRSMPAAPQSKIQGLQVRENELKLKLQAL